MAKMPLLKQSPLPPSDNFYPNDFAVSY